jgi:hypothetical protein
MKKILLTIVLAIFVLSTSACALVFGQQYYDPDEYGETYSEDYAYLDDYALVDWSYARYDIQYTYYDIDRVFLVIYGNRIYIIPYDYFWYYIYPKFRMRIIWRSYDWFCNYWGYGYYNSLWSHWHHRHHRRYWRPNYNYYYHHKNTNINKPIIIHKNKLTPSADANRGRYIPQPNKDTRYRPQFNLPRSNQSRIYVPKSTDGQNYRYTPRSDRPQVIQHQNTSPNKDSDRKSYSQTPVKDKDNNGNREKH